MCWCVDLSIVDMWIFYGVGVCDVFRCLWLWCDDNYDVLNLCVLRLMTMCIDRWPFDMLIMVLMCWCGNPTCGKRNIFDPGKKYFLSDFGRVFSVVDWWLLTFRTRPRFCLGTYSHMHVLKRQRSLIDKIKGNYDFFSSEILDFLANQTKNNLNQNYKIGNDCNRAVLTNLDR